MRIERAARLDDIDGDDSGDHTESGGAGDGAKSGSMGASLGGIRSALRSVIGGASGSKSLVMGTKKSGNSLDYRFAPLTIPNVHLFNSMRGSISVSNF